uniref:Uncharacterized protein n=2 Tax=Plectus sambesii TaxID=2011161 RepID=A0A914ULB8_9BILA
MHQSTFANSTQNNGTLLLQVPIAASLDRRRSSLMERLMQLREGLHRNRRPRCSEDSACGELTNAGGHAGDYCNGGHTRRSLSDRLHSSVRPQRPHFGRVGSGPRNSNRGPPRPRL